MQPKALYSAFDIFPSPKGAATHIRQMASTLFETFSSGMLYVLGDGAESESVREGEIQIFRERFHSPNYLERALAFAGRLDDIFENEVDTRGFELTHFRDAWSGKIVLRKTCSPSVFEVNGLPSIELTSKYQLPARTIEKLRERERECLDLATQIIVPSASIKSCLRAFGTPPEKIRVLANGAELFPPSNSREHYGVYFGALQRWQGVDTLIRAFALLRDLRNFSLVICSSSPSRAAKAYLKLAERLGVSDRMEWHFGLRQEELWPIVARARFSLAPLSDCARNSEQGCCPLKILESLACGTPVIASALPSVEELIRNGSEGMLVRPDRPSDLARAMRIALEYPERLNDMGLRGRLLVGDRYTWTKIRAELREIYHSLVSPRNGLSLAEAP